MNKKKWSSPELTNLSVKKTETSDEWVYTVSSKDNDGSGDSSSDEKL